MQLDEDFLKQDYYSGFVIDGLFFGGCYEGTLTKSVDEFTNEEWKYIKQGFSQKYTFWDFFLPCGFGSKQSKVDILSL